MGTALRSSHNVLLCRGARQLLEGAKYVHGQNKLRHFREIYIYIYTVYGIYNIHTHTGKACDTEDTSWLGRGLRKTTGMAETLEGERVEAERRCGRQKDETEAKTNPAGLR